MEKVKIENGKRMYHFKLRGNSIEGVAENLEEAYDYVRAICTDITEKVLESAYRTY